MTSFQTQTQVARGERAVRAVFYGRGKPLFLLYLRTALLTLVTLGIYRFWARTRIRKYIWSATSVADDTFEYTGTGLEKLLGFLLAVVVLAIYLGLVQTALAFFGLFLFAEPESEAQVIAQLAAFYISFLAVLPLIFFAQYRARRYRLARTRWRGIRFGMDLAAWGYAARALGHLLLTLVSFGLLWPRQSFWLEKYMTDRSYYGEARFHQGGRWTELYPGLAHVGLGCLILLLSGVVIATTEAAWLGGLGVLLGLVWFLVGLVHYRVFAFNYLTRYKRLDETVTFQARLTTREVLRHILLGALAIIGASLAGAFLVSMVFGVTMGIGLATGGLETQSLDAPPAFLGVISVLTVLVYVGVILLIGGLWLVLVTQKVIGSAVNSFTITNVAGLDKIRQRAGDQGADAEGFADALDIGGGI
ncbi:MAG: DUF898 family protein [Pseudomonadota bacterium]